MISPNTLFIKKIRTFQSLKSPDHILTSYHLPHTFSHSYCATTTEMDPSKTTDPAEITPKLDPMDSSEHGKASTSSNEPAEPVADQSEASLTSSYVPIENLTAIQLIDEHKQFNESVLEYIGGTGVSATGEHRIVAVFGSQSTGKSTLLNHLFNTNFGVMDEASRQQTTKGIWLAVSPGVSCTDERKAGPTDDKIVVMDVEGTDGTERGEDQDFERKAALFALATSEVLIVNLWETQVGWYQGANMGLIKTVFEVNLSLFGRIKLDSASDHKVLLLFVIRDHTGVTSKESLSATLTRDLLKIWDSLNKPAELAQLRFEDFFDLAFHTLSHKIFQNDAFVSDVKLLGDRFVDTKNLDYLFKPNYCHNIPIEGWTMYAESCWEQIDSNKDLDLPTQQIMVARIKCEELASASFTEFEQTYAILYSEAQKASESQVPLNYVHIGQALVAAHLGALSDYDIGASKYNQDVYTHRRELLSEKVLAKLQNIVLLYAELLTASTVSEFEAALTKRTKSITLVDAIEAAKKSFVADYKRDLELLSVEGQIPTDSYTERLQAELQKIEGEQKIAEVNALVNKYLRKLQTSLNSAVQSEISKASEETWDNIKERYENLQKTLLSKVRNSDGKYDFGIGSESPVTEIASQTIEYKSWETLLAAIAKFTSKENLFNVLKDRFDEKFGYDANGNPRVYLNTTELESSFVAAKNAAALVLPNLSTAILSDGNKFQPTVNLNSSFLRRKFESVASALKAGAGAQEDESDSEDEENERNFIEVVSEDDQQEVLRKFKRETDAIFVARKGAIVQSRTQIPYYIYLVILVLGWNEFMAVIRNPFFFSLLLVFGAGAYLMYQTNLLGPALIVGKRMVDESVNMAKQKLREFVIDDHQTHGHNLKKMASKEAIELDDLSEDGTRKED
ncbi:hypothetical protein PUMCH_003920 [Australozyma saopauloensis]|uniref:GB1/RHD3-type G domain-containing protein n=1 Tax=Australozyma saopauloensis TaxID=291208 RepID=A0AAX4HFA1_9ASCO|nr:hypothetical protein PUMCH_003920 [[Candida] saopauloensis]